MLQLFFSKPNVCSPVIVCSPLSVSLQRFIDTHISNWIPVGFSFKEATNLGHPTIFAPIGSIQPPNHTIPSILGSLYWASDQWNKI